MTALSVLQQVSALSDRFAFALPTDDGTTTLPAVAAIRHILATRLRADPCDGTAYRMIAGILAHVGLLRQAHICAAGSLVHALGRDFIDLRHVTTTTVAEAVSGQGVRVAPVTFHEPLEHYSPSRGVDLPCPPLLSRRPVTRRNHYAVEIARGRVAVGNVGYAVFTEDGAYLSDFCGNDGCLVAAADPAHRKRLVWLGGTVLTLANAYGNSNFHWMFETLPRLGLLRAAGIDLSAIDRVMVRPLHAYQIEILAGLGIPPEKLIFTSEVSHFAADRLIVTSNLEHYDHAHNPPSIEIEGWICRFLATAFGFPDRDPDPAARRIHISRRKAAWRNLVNQEEVSGYLEANGFQTVHFEDLTLAQKHHLLRSAEVVTGLFGAGFAHLPFCRPGTRVVPFYPPECITDSYWMVCNHMNLEHHHVIGDSAHRFYPAAQAGRNFATVDTLVDIDRLHRTFQAAGLTGLRHP